MEWIKDNLATIIVGLLLLTAVIFAIYRLIKEHRNGKCSVGCPGCSIAGKCPYSKQ